VDISQHPSRRRRVHLPKDHPNFERQLVGHGQHLKRIVQIVADTAGKPIDEMRVLDLGCLEGLYAVEFALRGAEVVGIEGRETNLVKANFAKETLGLDRLSFALDDARKLSKEKYGEFDVALCLGLLYHLDAPDVFEFVERVAEVTRRVCIIDTHVSVKPDKSVSYKGHEYRGWAYREHEAQATNEQRAKALWSSLKDEFSFWLSRPSLYNLLLDSGFTSAYACHAPVAPEASLTAIPSSR
jgi:SAM-dependent methyltransferase